jgi:hypothetical protein
VYRLHIRFHNVPVGQPAWNRHLARNLPPLHYHKTCKQAPRSVDKLLQLARVQVPTRGQAQLGQTVKALRAGIDPPVSAAGSIASWQGPQGLRPATPTGVHTIGPCHSMTLWDGNTVAWCTPHGKHAVL